MDAQMSPSWHAGIEDARWPLRSMPAFLLHPLAFSLPSIASLSLAGSVRQPSFGYLGKPKKEIWSITRCSISCCCLVLHQLSEASMLMLFSRTYSSSLLLRGPDYCFSPAGSSPRLCRFCRSLVSPSYSFSTLSTPGLGSKLGLVRDL